MEYANSGWCNKIVKRKISLLQSIHIIIVVVVVVVVETRTYDRLNKYKYPSSFGGFCEIATLLSLNITHLSFFKMWHT